MTLVAGFLMMGEGEVLPVWSFLLAFHDPSRRDSDDGRLLRALRYRDMLLKLANLAGGEGGILADYATSDPTGTHRIGGS
jgi:hypothetical protein